MTVLLITFKRFPCEDALRENAQFEKEQNMKKRVGVKLKGVHC